VDFLPAENREAFFVEDKIHFNQAGYELYADYFREALKDELALY
jgi:lysophospholipase L1-like esterase